jgi:hypothetical protein
MFGSTILEVAIGMVFVYLLLSLVCSALNELIEAGLKMRAKDLEKGLLTLFNEPDRTATLSRDFFAHPLIKALGKNPSYIPSRTFSLALWNIASTVGQAGPGVAAVTRDLGKIRATVAAFPNEDVKRALLTLIDEAGNDFDRARENVERWYDDVMDRVSGGYKRRTQWILLVLALGLAAGLNVDTLKIAGRLYSDTPLRETLAATAEGYAAAGRESGQAADKAIQENFAVLQGLGLPIGWTEADRPASPASFLAKILGLLLTAMAVSLGAPFWFDVLNKFMVVRSTIKPREKSQETPSKDRRIRRNEDEDEDGEAGDQSGASDKT